MPDDGCPLLDEHDHRRRIGWVLGSWVHDDSGLVVLAEVPDWRAIRSLGLSVHFVSAAHWETSEAVGGLDVVTYSRAWVDEISTVRNPACRVAGIRGWRPALRTREYIERGGLTYSRNNTVPVAA